MRGPLTRIALIAFMLALAACGDFCPAMQCGP